jgi:hypothetical protein
MISRSMASMSPATASSFSISRIDRRDQGFERLETSIPTKTRKDLDNFVDALVEKRYPVDDEDVVTEALAHFRESAEAFLKGLPENPISHRWMR